MGRCGRGTSNGRRVLCRFPHTVVLKSSTPSPRPTGIEMISEAVGGSRDTGVSQQFRPPGTLRVQQHISSFEHPPDTPTTEPPDRHTRAARSRVSAFTNKAHFWCARTHPQAVVACERRTKVASPVLTSEKLAVPYLAKPSHPNPPSTAGLCT